MYQYKVLVVDDDAEAGRAIEIALELFVPKDHIFRATNIAQAKQFLSTEKIDVSILDISLQNENGFELAAYIRDYYPELPYIFATGYTQFALDGYKFQPLDFLVKPFSSMALKEALDRVKPIKRKRCSTARIGVPFNGGFHLLDVDQIIYVMKVNRKIIVQLRDEEIVLQKYTMEKMEAILHDYGFIRVHQSFLVAVKMIESVVATPFGNAHEIKMEGVKRNIPISRSKYSVIKKYLEEQGVQFLG